MENPVRSKVSEIFLGLSPAVTMDAIRAELTGNPDFLLYEDPNRNPKTSVVGKVNEYKHLNKAAIGNQLIVALAPSSNPRQEVITFTWLIHYKMEDLAIALVDFDKFKAEFKPLFGSSTVSREIGYEREEIEALLLKSGTTEITLKMIKSNNLRHTLSMQYKEIRRKKRH